MKEGSRKEVKVYFSEKPFEFFPRLVERIYKIHKRLLIVAKDVGEGEWMDDILWTYTPVSFLPHGSFVKDSFHHEHPVWISEKVFSREATEVLFLMNLVSLEAWVQWEFTQIVILLENTEDNKTAFHQWYATVFSSLSHHCVQYEQTKKGWVSG